jgi:hypothetical protein
MPGTSWDELADDFVVNPPTAQHESQHARVSGGSSPVSSGSRSIVAISLEMLSIDSTTLHESE